MPQTRPDTLIANLTKQEEDLRFPAFNEEISLALGLELTTAATDRSAPVVIDIRTPDRTLFHAALPGATTDNDHWARRKSNVVLRFHRSSRLVGETMRAKGATLGPDRGLDPMDFADHGGSFPIRLTSGFVVGAITVSGLTSAEDHDLIVSILESYLPGLAATSI